MSWRSKGLLLIAGITAVTYAGRSGPHAPEQNFSLEQQVYQLSTDDQLNLCARVLDKQSRTRQYQIMYHLMQNFTDSTKVPLTSDDRMAFINLRYEIENRNTIINSAYRPLIKVDTLIIHDTLTTQ